VEKNIEKALNTTLSETNRAELIAFQETFINENED